MAAVWVVLFHYTDPFTALLPGFSWAAPIVRFGNLGVDLFFILSGFILAYVYRLGTTTPSWRDYWRFLWFRFARIYPNHIVALVVIVGMLGAAGLLRREVAGVYTATGYIAQIALLQAWPWINGEQWNYPAWSISAEWFAYLFIFPIAWKVLRWPLSAVCSGWLIYLCLLTWIACSIVPALAPVHNLLRVSCEFLAGSFLYSFHRHQTPATRYFQRNTGSVALVIGVIMIASFQHTFLASCMAILAIPSLLLGLTAETSWLAGALTTRPSLWFGHISYALYMSHAIIQNVLEVALPTSRFSGASFPVRVAVFLGYWCALIGGAALLYYAIEVPSRTFLRHHRPRLRAGHLRLDTPANSPPSATFPQ